MSHEARFPQSFWGSIRDAGRLPREMACRGMYGGKPQTLHMTDFYGYYTAGVCDWGVGNRVHVGHISISTQGRRQVPWNLIGGGAMESN